MIPLSQIPVRFCPSKETLAVLNDRTWICSYSGGKDSTSVVTWIEWLRRTGLVNVASPRLVLSDTEVEYPFLEGISRELMNALKATGSAAPSESPLNHSTTLHVFQVMIGPYRNAVVWECRNY